MRFVQTTSLVIGIFALLALPASAGSEEKARRAFADGQALLAKADFEGALAAIKTAAKAQSKNPEYIQLYTLLRQVVQLRKQLPKEKNLERWMQGAGSLHTFYHDYELFAQSLPLDEERYRRSPSAESAVLLAETQLALGMYSQAAEILGGLSTESQSPRARVLHRLALARQGRVDDAQSLTENPNEVDASAGPSFFYDLARLLAVVGKRNESLRSLTRAIELTAPDQIEAFKERIRKCQDFSTARETSEFAEVMKTASIIKESGCSGGSGCGKCPKRAGCGSKNSPKTDDKP